MLLVVYLFVVASATTLANANMMFGLPPNLFGHKASYLWRFPNQSFTKNELMTVQSNGKICKAIQFNYVGRHGARFPGTDDLNYFDDLKQKILDHSDGTRYPFLKTWQDYPPKEHGHIEDLGRIEMNHLGDMYGTALYDLFRGKISPSTIKLAGVNKKRTRTSAAELYKGLTKTVTGTGLTDIKPIKNEPVIAFFDNCPMYQVAVWQNVTNLREPTAFQNSSFFQGVISNVTARLGMNISLSISDIKKIFLLCSTELAVRNNTNWCDMLTVKDRDILNYESDTEDYYTILYGHKMIAPMSCPLWVDVFASLDNAINSYAAKQNYLLGDIRVGRSTTMDAFYAALGLFKDHMPLRADNYLQMTDRILYESKITPFGAHVAFILYNCGDPSPQNYMLKMLVNGKPMVIPKCGSDTCRYTDVKAQYRQYIDQCQWRKLCTVTVQPPVG